MSQARSEDLAVERQYSDRRPGFNRDDDDDDDEYRRQGTPRKRSWSRTLSDLFD
jgi:hypothetical protein